MDGFKKFPRTRHLFDAGGSGVTRDDLLYTKRDANALFYSGQTVHIEEKVDGANMGFSIAEDGRIMAQNRSHYVNQKSHAQFKRLDAWISQHMGDLYAILEEPKKYILFGEWLYATHSVEYTTLPSYFLAFDIYDIAKGRFLSRKSFYEKLKDTGIKHVPTIATITLKGEDDVRALLDTTSEFSDGVIEGVYLRVDDDGLVGDEPLPATKDSDSDSDGNGNDDSGDADDDGDGDDDGVTYLAYRSKVVRPDFLQGITSHWAGHTVKRNVLAEGIYE